MCLRCVETLPPVHVTTKTFPRLPRPLSPFPRPLPTQRQPAHAHPSNIATARQIRTCSSVNVNEGFPLCNQLPPKRQDEQQVKQVLNDAC